jgi:hypothetical protein
LRACIRDPTKVHPSRRPSQTHTPDVEAPGHLADDPEIGAELAQQACLHHDTYALPTRRRQQNPRPRLHCDGPDVAVADGLRDLVDPKIESRGNRPTSSESACTRPS